MSAGTKAEDFRKLAEDQLAARLLEAKQELFNLRFQQATSATTNALLTAMPPSEFRGRVEQT